MPFLVDCAPVADWRADATPLAALVSAPAYCLVSQGRGRPEVLPETFSEEKAQLLLEALSACDERFFGMEVGGSRVAPFYVAAFRRESPLMSLFYYYGFRESGEVAPTPAVEAYTIYRLAERILGDYRDIDGCYVPIPLAPPRHHVSAGSGSKEVLSFPRIEQREHGDGVLLMCQKTQA